MTKENKVFFLVIVLFVVIVFSAAYSQASLDYSTETEVVKVVNKNYNRNLAVQVATKTYPLNVFAKYEVYVLYEDQEYCLDDEELYNTVEVGNTIEVVVTKSFNKNGELKNTEINIGK